LRKIKSTLIIKNSRQLLTLSFPTEGPHTQAHMQNLEIIQDGAVAITDNKIVAVGKTDDVLSKVEIDKNTKIIDAKGKVVSPGFVDPHTHPVFAATREEEFEMRIKGKSYQEIAEAGGGIRSSVRNLRKCSKEELIKLTAFLGRRD